MKETLMYLTMALVLLIDLLMKAFKKLGIFVRGESNNKIRLYMGIAFLYIALGINAVEMRLVEFVKTLDDRKEGI